MFSIIRQLMMMKFLSGKANASPDKAPANPVNYGDGVITPKKVIITIVLIVVIIWLFKKIVLKPAAEAVTKLKNQNAEGTQNMELVHKFYQAGHTGVFGSTEDETKLIELGAHVGSRENLKAVNKLYSAKYQVDLIDELVKWLDEDQLEQFYINVDK